MSDLDYDGLCGMPLMSPLRDGRYLRCRWVLGHAGSHSWQPYVEQFGIFGGIALGDVLERARAGSVAARAMIGQPDNCSCIPKVVDWTIVDYLFDGDCEAHSPPSGQRQRT